MKKKTGGGRFDPDEQTVYFMAGGDYAFANNVKDEWTLIAVNDLMDSDARMNVLKELVDTPHFKVLLDSGIFNLTNRHMRKNGITMEDALALDPEAIDGFDELFDAYVRIATEMAPDLWGYIELDQGGATNKRKIRAQLEDVGLVPIPVYHPLNDGWEYFDELCEQYDRICLGNVVQASADTRRHLLSTLWERRRHHPDVWIHVLGLTPSEVTTAYPVPSADSSSWMGAMRYGASSAKAKSMGDAFSGLPESYSYNMLAERDDPNGYRKAVAMFSSEARFLQYNMRRQALDVCRVFGDDALLPPPDDKENVRR